MSDETKETAKTAGDQQQQVRVQVEDKHAVTSYANFCRVTGTPEELIIDFGLNSQPFGVPQEAVQITQRIVTNYYTAKRMLHALHLSVHANHLNRVVKEVTGKTTTGHIADRIVKEAKALLLHTNWNVSEIAYSLGFEYPAYFNNFFKKQTQQTPRSFRA